MPNRILKESVCTSDSINELGWFEEVLFYRLIVNCDDFGRFDGRTAVVKNRLFPLKDNLTLKSVETAINKLARVGLVSPYMSGGKPFLFLPTWNEHQSIRAKRSKYPEPEIICNQVQADESKCPRNPIQSESESESNPNVCAEQETRSTPAYVLPLNSGEHFVYEPDVAHWRELYPAVDVDAELRKMIGWLESNPSKRKTARGVAGFITRWLSKAQDSGRPAPQRAQNKQAACDGDNAWMKKHIQARKEGQID